MSVNQHLKLSSRRGLKVSWLLTISVFSILGTSCKKLIEIDPPIQNIVGSSVFQNNATAASVLTGIYTDMSNYGIFSGVASMSVRLGAAADELTVISNPNDILSSLYTNSLTNNGGQLFWSDLYAYIFKANSAIEGISSSTKLTDGVKSQLLGEAKFVRALMYFYLVNLYGDVPLLMTTDLKANSVSPRTDRNVVYKAIERDLLEAQILLNGHYTSSDASTVSSLRIRPNKAVATALLARIFLYTHQWSKAEAEASKLIENTTDYNLEPLASVFLASSKEAIWQLQPVGTVDLNTFDALVFVLEEGANGFPAAGPNADSRPVFLSEQLLSTFENADLRKSVWIGTVTVGGGTYNYPKKYSEWIPGNPRTEYLMVFRLAEQYLIRAEARAQLEKIEGDNSAISDLNSIRIRVNLKPLNLDNRQEILDAILRERRAELFTEWGQRWLDLKRTNMVNQVMTIVAPSKGGIWADYKALFPIPIQDMQRNPKLHGHQNPGYPEQ